MVQHSVEFKFKIFTLMNFTHEQLCGILFDPHGLNCGSEPCPGVLNECRTWLNTARLCSPQMQYTLGAVAGLRLHGTAS